MARLTYCCDHVLLLLLCLLPVSSMAKDYWAINCGSSEPFTSALNMTWEPDDDYVHGGVSRAVNSSDRVLQTLRAFEADKPGKGCYTIPVGNETQILVRAWFFYGNYDGKEDPPTLRLQFDANEWGVIETSMDSWTYREVIYVTASTATSICVARERAGQTPFISGLEVAVLEDDMYNSVNASLALFMVSRVAFGANETIRDKYWRNWSKSTSSLNISEYTILANTVTTLNVSGIADNPPSKVFETAIAAASPLSNITITTPYLSSIPQPIYFNLYFTEPEDPTKPGSHNRSFHVTLNGQVIFEPSKPIVPPYGKGKQYTSAVRKGSKSTVIELVSTPDANQPPVISAWELFLISDLLSGGTDSRDVNGLQALQDTFKILQDWAGDPCLPKSYNWEWVTCSSDAPPRITALNLRGYGLSGELADFSSLDALQTIDLSNNYLTGAIPSFLAELPSLHELNLADNDFSSIPSSLVQKSNIKLDFSGNPKLPCIGQACSPAAARQAQLEAKEKSSADENSKETIMTILIGCMMYATAAVVW